MLNLNALQDFPRVDAKALEQEINRKLLAVQQTMDRQEEIYRKLLRLERLSRLESFSTWKVLRRLDQRLEEIARQQEGVIFREQFASVERVSPDTTAWVDVEAQRLTLHPIQMTPARARDLSLHILTDYSERSESGRLESILSNDGVFNLQVLHPTDSRLSIALEGVLLDPCNRIRLVTEVLGGAEGELYIGEDSYRTSGDVLEWELPEFMTGPFRIILYEILPQREEGDLAVTAVRLERLILLKQSPGAYEIYRSRPTKLDRRVRSLTLYVEEKRPRDTDLQYEMALFQEGDPVHWTTVEPGVPWVLEEPYPVREVFSPNTGGYGELWRSSFGVDHYRVGHLREIPVLDTLVVRAGAGQWRVDRAPAPDKTTDLTPEAFDELSSSFSGYVISHAETSVPVSASEWMRLRTFVKLKEPTQVIWPAPRFSGPMAVYVNGQRQAVDSAKIFGMFKAGTNEVVILVAGTEDGSLILEDHPSLFDLYAEAYPLRRVHIDVLLHETGRNEPFVYAVDHEGWIVQNQDPRVYGAAYEASYLIDRPYERDTYVAVQVHLRCNGLVPPALSTLEIRAD